MGDLEGGFGEEFEMLLLSAMRRWVSEVLHGRTRVVRNALASRGKSLTPESRIEMVEPRS